MRKNIIIAFIGVLFLTSCEKENSNKLPFSESHLEINAVKSFLPASYFQGAKFIFKDLSGNEKEIHSVSTETTRELTEGEFTYMADNFNVLLFDPADEIFKIVITGNANYSSNGSPVRYLVAMLMPFNASGNTPGTIDFEEEGPIISQTVDFRSSIELNNKVYNNVFMNFGMNGLDRYDSYSELDINSELGVVAFRDENNELWNLDRIED